MNVIDWKNTIAAIWRARQEKLKAVVDVDLMEMDQLLCIDAQKQAFTQNLENFIQGKPCNHVLLWGARGTGKSSLVKAALNSYQDQGLRVIEIPKDELRWLIDISDEVRDLKYRFVIFCDDLSFEEGETCYKELKSTLQGSIEKPPENILVVATSNRRHLISERMSDNLQSKTINGEIHHSDTIEEKMSLSDRFGLSLSFYPLKQDEYFKIIDKLFEKVEIDDRDKLHVLAARFATERGSRSGRIAIQFFKSRIDQLLN
ncbi:MAG: ATP-binding protein [Cocleimonas sp.]